MRLSGKQLDLNLPYWRDYRPFLQHLAGPDFPSCGQLNALLPEGLCNASGHPIRFVPSTELEDDGYEHRIYASGRISTRPDNWHDLFNALVWMRFPRMKVAMNTLHFHALAQEHDGSRGKLRDALTLFDECGVMVFSAHADLLMTLAERDWSAAFLTDEFRTGVKLSLCGHAMLEKYLAPYKSMTAKALLIHTDADFQELSTEQMLNRLDAEIAERMLGGTLMTEPACLAPLPLAGVPFWWPEEQQAEAVFYDDRKVFRAPPANLVPVNVLEL